MVMVEVLRISYKSETVRCIGVDVDIELRQRSVWSSYKSI